MACRTAILISGSGTNLQSFIDKVAAGELDLDLRGDDGAFEVTWFDPRTGDWHAGGVVGAGSVVSLGSAPFGGDVAVRLRRLEDAAPAGEPGNDPSPDPVPVEPTPEEPVSDPDLGSGQGVEQG